MATAIPYPNDGEEFRADLKAAGFVVSGLGEHIDKIKNTLGCSRQHARNMISGWNRYSKPMRAKMKVLIDNSNKALTDDIVLKQINYTKGSPFDETIDLSANNRFAVIDATDGTAVIVEIIATFRDHTMARKLCQKLNDENQ